MQAVDEQKPGRTPDMSPPAANAFLAVLQEVGSGQGLVEKKETEASGDRYAGIELPSAQPCGSRLVAHAVWLTPCGARRVAHAVWSERAA